MAAEQSSGMIRIMDRNTHSISGTFLEIAGLSTGNEQGLLGLAFDPNYASNGFLYVHVTVAGGDTEIRRYQASGTPTTATTANAASATTLLSFDQPQGNHNGGRLSFGPNDEYLYIASGDGGNRDDTGTGHTVDTGNAQDITSNWLGKRLRIDVPDDTAPEYSIPPTNPLVNKTGDDEIWSYGLCNPYRASFDRETGDREVGPSGGRHPGFRDAGK